MDQNVTPLFDAILNYISDEITPLHIPSHKMGSGINPKWKNYAGENIFKMDLCEVQGLDDIHNPQGVIKEAQALAAEAWGADQSYFLVNGTSAGIIASICSVVSPGDTILLPRNIHKSIIAALIISGAIPVYINPDIDNSRGLVGGMPPQKLIEEYLKNQDAKAVFTVSPSYYGIGSDVKKIIEITHDFNGILIADEAHGNHMYFHERFSDGAISLGADLTCQSTHKMSGSLTQSSMLHVKGSKVDRRRLENNLQLIQTTSPSYLLEASLDLARHYLVTCGRDIFDGLLQLSEQYRNKISSLKGIEVVGPDIVGQNSIAYFDPMRLVISARKLGIEGYELYRILRERYKVEAEFGDYFYVVCILGLGTTAEDLERLYKALQDVSQNSLKNKDLHWEEKLPPIPKQRLSPRDAYWAQKADISFHQAKGKIAAQMIVPYPPGIPVVCPGEIITEEIWEYVSYQIERDRHLHGLYHGEDCVVSVVADS